MVAGLALAAADPAIAQAPENTAAILDATLNGEPLGRLVVEISPTGDVLIAVTDFQTLEITGLPPGAGRISGDQISLRALAPDVTFEVNQEIFVLAIRVRPDLLGSSAVNLRPKSSPAPLVRSNNAYLNYFATLGLDDSFGFRSLSAPWEVGANIGELHGESAFTYSLTPTESQFVRNLTTFTWDSPSAIRRTRAGDVAVATGRLGGAASLGGIAVNSEFSLQPDLLRVPTFEVGSLIETASEVELYVNGSLISTQRVPPGQLQFLNLQLPSGTSDVVIVIRDDAGREEIIRDVFYFSSRLLRSGIHEYSYAAGFRRENLGQTSFDYGPAMAGGFHRYGLSSAVTVGARFEIGNGIVSGGPSLATTLGRLGEIETGFAYSGGNGRSGYGGFFDYRWLRGGFSVRASFDGNTDTYANLSRRAISGDRLRGSVGAGYSSRALGSFSVDAGWLKRDGTEWLSTLTGR